MPRHISRHISRQITRAVTRVMPRAICHRLLGDEPSRPEMSAGLGLANSRPSNGQNHVQGKTTSKAAAGRLRGRAALRTHGLEDPWPQELAASSTCGLQNFRPSKLPAFKTSSLQNFQPRSPQTLMPFRGIEQGSPSVKPAQRAVHDRYRVGRRHRQSESLRQLLTRVRSRAQRSRQEP
jgi:hypothetical protein